MDPKFIPILADGIRAYYRDGELQELCEEFGVELLYDTETQRPAFLQLARTVIGQLDHGNNRRFLEAMGPSLVFRARENAMRTRYEEQEHHEAMLIRLEPLEAELEKDGLPAEISVPEERPFTAKSAAREFLGQSKTPVTVVDNYVGPGTLDCLRDVDVPIRLLTGRHPQAIADGFDRALQEFRAEGHAIEVRQHARLHDRYLLFNDRCWLVGSSLKDAGKKAFNVIEIVDGKAAIQAEVERKWNEGVVL